MKKVYPIKINPETITDLQEIAEKVKSYPSKLARNWIESGVKKFKKTGKI